MNDCITNKELDMLCDLYKEPENALEYVIHTAAKELRRYRELKDKGLLAILPCAIGDTVYAVEDKPVLPLTVDAVGVYLEGEHGGDWERLSNFGITVVTKDAIFSDVSDDTWLDEDDLEKLEKIYPEKADVIDSYLHGNCDEWVLENFRDGDIAVIWNEFSEEIGKVALIHCYIKRGDDFVDVRGKTPDEELIADGFDYGYDHDKIYCSSLEEYKSYIREICGYEDEKWCSNSNVKGEER